MQRCSSGPLSEVDSLLASVENILGGEAEKASLITTKVARSASVVSPSEDISPKASLEAEQQHNTKWILSTGVLG